MMLRRACPRPTRPEGAIHWCWASGPRCSSVAVARRSDSGTTGSWVDMRPTIPHMVTPFSSRLENCDGHGRPNGGCLEGDAVIASLVEQLQPHEEVPSAKRRRVDPGVPGCGVRTISPTPNARPSGRPRPSRSWGERLGVSEGAGTWPDTVASGHPSNSEYILLLPPPRLHQTSA